MKKTLSIFLALLMFFASFSFAHAETSDEQSETITFEDVLAGVVTLEEYNATRTKGDIIAGIGDGGFSFPAGTYYLNNQSSSGFLRNAASSLSTKSGLINDLGNSIRWVVISDGKDYYIRSASDSTKYLGVPAFSNGSAVRLVTVSSGSSVPLGCRWTISIAASGVPSSPGGVHIRSKLNFCYLMANGASVSTDASVGSSLIEKEKRIWRAASTSYYSNGSSSTKRELTANTSIKNIEIAVGASGAIVVNKAYSNELWALPADFTYTFSKSGMVSRSGATIKGSSGKYGGVTVTATHKVTGRKKTFYVLLGYSTTLSSTPKPTYKTQEYNQWPALKNSLFYNKHPYERTIMLNAIETAAGYMVIGTAIAELFNIPQYNYPLARDMLSHFLGNQGTRYTIDFKSAIARNTTPKVNRKDDMNALIAAVEATASNTQKIIRTIETIPHAIGEGDWYYAINKYNVAITCSYKKTGNKYTANVTYELYDMYDFEQKPGEVGLVSFADMWELHHGGRAKNYEVYGKNTFTMTWTQGQTFGNGVTISNEN